MIAGRFNVLMSLSPKLFRGHPATAENGRAHQKRCVQSWLDAGACVISMNNQAEIALLEDDYKGVLFTRCKEGDVDNPRNLPTLTDMLELGRSLADSRVFAVVNSDVYFSGSPPMLEALFAAAEGRVIMSNRHECAPTGVEVGLPYLYGYDFIIVDRDYIVPEEMKGFIIGSPWWDYLFLYLLAARDVPLSMLTSPVIVHSTHEQAWNHDRWRAGLSEIAKRIRELASEEGPAAALLGFICRNLEAGVMPGFAASEIESQLGIVLGMAMVSYIAERCEEIIWFSSDDTQDLHPVGGSLRRALYEAPWRRLD